MQKIADEGIIATMKSLREFVKLTLSIISCHRQQLFWNMVSVFDCRVCRLQTAGMQCLSFFTYCLLVYKYRIWQFRLKP